jgi:hypothetical protein
MDAETRRDELRADAERGAEPTTAAFKRSAHRGIRQWLQGSIPRSLNVTIAADCNMAVHRSELRSNSATKLCRETITWRDKLDDQARISLK